MAAEKLTKARLIQILFLMAVLITAFVWRTVTYEQSTPQDEGAVRCQISEESCLVEGQGDVLAMSLKPFPVKANSEITLQISNTNVKPVATVAGVEMYMGEIPVIFEQQGNNWLGKFSVPDCVHEKMTWEITIKQSNETVIAEFTVEK
ncbi:hypothetical protein MD588_18890 [Photobacterium sp. SDRW27]|uniref:hypothetical protein n=1 Tax=Photobacterium obscurum TaxID=2829490 RepID=UPI0022449379|nr:hypothetical protein [Photobacterium obscurum]MCW8330863.1 hypothetical protein [Photobacterium obscurum]